MDRTSIEPLVFGPNESPLFGMFTMPPPRIAVDRGVVICAALGYENVIYHRQLAILARRLAADGRPTLRFDWPGTGDSAGDDRQGGLVEAYIDAVGTAMQALREHTNVAEVDVMGLRIGGTFAAAAAARGDITANVVLWAPFTTGTAYMRETRAFHRLSVKAAHRAELRDELEGEEASGFLLARSTIDGLKRLDLLTTEFANRSPERVLLSGRDKPPDERLVAHLREAGLAVDAKVFGGLREVALGWTERPVPLAAFDAIANWLPSGSPSGGLRARAPAVSRMRLEVSGSPINEQAIVLGDPEPVFGIAATATDQSSRVADAGAWVVFATNRYSRRTGPNRLYTRWAREWAARGIPSLRLDLSGTGDAGGPDEETDADMYSSQVLEDARMALAFLRNHYGARRFVIIGLCSGAYTGFHAALVEPEVEGVVLLNPQMLLWTRDATAVTRARNLMKRVPRLAAWKRLFQHRGALLRHVAPTVGGAMVASVSWRTSLLVRNLRRMPDVNPVHAWCENSLDRLTRRGCSLLFVFSGGDHGLDYLQRHLGSDYDDSLRRRGIAMRVVEGTDHSFQPMWSQDALQGIVEEHLRACRFPLRGSDWEVPVPTSAIESISETNIPRPG